MSTRLDAATPWPWVTTTIHVRPQAKAGRQEMWAGALYLLVWSVLWLAVIVAVLAPLDGLLLEGLR
jgi:hypothetical protein